MITVNTWVSGFYPYIFFFRRWKVFLYKIFFLNEQNLWTKSGLQSQMGVAVQNIYVRIKTAYNTWNDTVANLTLMAFGSSTPEILLSIIELFAKDMHTGELGAATIVGSAGGFR